MSGVSPVLPLELSSSSVSYAAITDEQAAALLPGYCRFVAGCRVLAERVRANRLWRATVCAACTPATQDSCSDRALHRLPCGK
jgi:hypothetical protein